MIYKTVILNKILSRISYIETTDKNKRVMDNITIHEWRELHPKYLNDEIFLQNYVATPFEKSDVYAALNARLKTNISANVKYNPKKE